MPSIPTCMHNLISYFPPRESISKNNIHITQPTDQVNTHNYNPQAQPISNNLEVPKPNPPHPTQRPAQRIKQRTKSTQRSYNEATHNVRSNLPTSSTHYGISFVPWDFPCSFASNVILGRFSLVLLRVTSAVSSTTGVVG